MTISASKKTVEQVDDAIKEFKGTSLITFINWKHRTLKTLRESVMIADSWFGYLMKNVKGQAKE